MGSMFVLVGVLSYVFCFLFLLGGFLMKSSKLTYLLDFNLMMWGSVDMSYELLFDWVSSTFMGAVLLISGSVSIYSNGYMSGDKTEKRFILLMVLFILSMLLMVSSGGMISMMLGWDGLGVISYLLVIYYNSSDSYKSGMITIMTNRVGDVLIIVSIGMLLSMGMWSFIIMDNVSGLGLFLMVAACTKSAQVPFSAWLPEAMAAPTPVSSLVHSSTLVTAGVFLLIRLEFFLKYGVSSDLLMYMSLMTMILSGSCALFEMDSKKVVASSTLSQLGLMMFSLSNGLWMITYFHMLMHAFFKALMFMCVGNIMWMEQGSQDMRFSSFKFNVSCFVNQGFLISVMCLSGFPFFCGFFSKDLMLEIYLMMEKGLISMGMFMLGFSFSVFYGMRLFKKMMIKLGEEKIYNEFREDYFMNVGIFVLMMFSLLGGSIYSWMEDSYMEIMLSFKGMILGVSIMVLGMVFMLWWSNFSVVSGIKFNNLKVISFMSSMWCLSFLSGALMNKMLSGSGDFNEEDQNWVEEIGGGGVYNLSLWFIKFYNSKLLDFFLLVLLMLMVMIMLI